MIIKNLSPDRIPGPLNMMGATGLTWRHACRMVFSPLRFMSDMANQYGDLTHFRLFGRRGYLLNHPDLIAQVLLYESDAFEKLPRQVGVLRQIFGQGILLAEGQRWKLDRQHLQRAFDKTLLERNVAATVACTHRMLDRWKTTNRISMVREMNLLTAHISLLAFTGEDVSAVVGKLSEAVVCMSDEFASEMNSVFRLPDWLPLSNKRRKRNSIEFYNRLFDQLIASRRTISICRNDFLQYLIDQPAPDGAGPDFVRDQLLTILIAAYHATPMALVWIFYLLETHADVEKRLVNELARLTPQERTNPNRILKLDYLKSVIAESLRLYPPAWALFARRSKREVWMRGCRIAAGGWFYISPFVTHRCETFFRNALTFDPDRFSPARIHEIPKHAYFPFGFGGRSCIGSRLALDQLQLITALILNRYQLRRSDCSSEPRLVAKLALRPKGDFNMNIRAVTLARSTGAGGTIPISECASFPTMPGSKV